MQWFRELATSLLKDLLKQGLLYVFTTMGIAAVLLRYRSVQIPLWAALSAIVVTRLVEAIMRAAFAKTGMKLAGSHLVPFEPPPEGYTSHMTSSAPSHVNRYMVWEGVQWVFSGPRDGRFVNFPDLPKCPEDTSLEPWEFWLLGQRLNTWWRCRHCRKNYPRPKEHPYATAEAAYRIMKGKIDTLRLEAARQESEWNDYRE